jgi:3-phosphoshikimate 1-carboxyvinyltransferase
MTVVGARDPVPVRYALPVPSAQVKSAILLAGLNAPGETVVIEREATRDHTERMLRGFGRGGAGRGVARGARHHAAGQPELRPQVIAVPRDPSSRPFPVCAGLVVPGSDVLVPEHRAQPDAGGAFTTLREMGADLAFENRRRRGASPSRTCARGSREPEGVEVPAPSARPR